MNAVARIRCNTRSLAARTSTLLLAAGLIQSVAHAQLVSNASFGASALCHLTDPNAQCFAGSLDVPVTCDCDRRQSLIFNGVPVEYQSVGSGITSGGVAPQADVQTAVTNGGYSDIRSTITYVVGVFPLTPEAVGRAVPLLVQVRGHVTTSSSGRRGDFATATATSQLCYINDCVTGTVTSRCRGTAGCDGSRSFNLAGVLNVLVEEDGSLASGTVSAIATAQAQPTSNQDVFGSVEAEAVADPEVVIDPSYEFRNEYLLVQSRNLYCPSDFNVDGVVDFFDYLDFVLVFSSADAAADFNLDGVVDFFDYLDFVAAFSTGC